MNKKEMTPFDLLIESHLQLDRQGPGSAEMTVKALSFINKLNENSRVVDIGCGTGGQTMVLAENTNAHIIGLDMIPDFINMLSDTAKKRSLLNRVQGVVGDALNLPFEKEWFDLIWSEGMIDSLGYEKALRYWNRFLKKGGYVVVSNPSWLTTEEPAEIEKFWADAGSCLRSIGSNIDLMQKSEYSFIASFTLPEECWMQNYFIPRQLAEKELLRKYPDNKTVEDYVCRMKHEVDLYIENKQYYGYVFYIGKKLG